MEGGAVLGARCTGALRFYMTALEDRSLVDERSTAIRRLRNWIESEQFLLSNKVDVEKISNTPHPFQSSTLGSCLIFHDHSLACCAEKLVQTPDQLLKSIIVARYTKSKRLAFPFTVYNVPDSYSETSPSPSPSPSPG